MNPQHGYWPSFPHTMACAVALSAVFAAADVAHAQFTFLNQIAGGPTNSPGYLPLPAYVGGVGPDGQLLIDEGPSGSSHLVKAYAADGTYLRTMSQELAGPYFSTIGPDGTYYVSNLNGEGVAVYNSSGIFPHFAGPRASPFRRVLWRAFWLALRGERQSRRGLQHDLQRHDVSAARLVRIGGNRPRTVWYRRCWRNRLGLGGSEFLCRRSFWRTRRGFFGGGNLRVVHRRCFGTWQTFAAHGSCRQWHGPGLCGRQ